ncbi:pyruvate kinase [Lyngbya confervoides]|uniref:Pyruvate kinase n=1 Tax=Lyngbya confervoides BDU141951 TaxID=1574623 RepID=A0ABD4T2B7_9CYAN|nr:pyruvate kinase [Lyngbya confervoides]MCM1982573.1 pyruvate kinase [Lyngbya confervoides BDU141951]
MKPLIHRTKIVATIGPASDSPAIIRSLLNAGMNVARLNFSHGDYSDHAQRIQRLRSAAAEMDLPLMILQDLQGPKIRVGSLPQDFICLQPHTSLTLVPNADFSAQPHTVGIDYPDLAEEAIPGTPILLDDGLLELRVEAVQGRAVQCLVIKGGLLKSRKGVNLPTLNLRLPSVTAKDEQDLGFGIDQGVDLISLSFVRHSDDIRHLKRLLTAQGSQIPVLAKLEKPQAIANLDAIIEASDAIMVARGDLGVELNPEKVPLIQKKIIQRCNERGKPVITATQMLDSMIEHSRPTRAEASDVANAIIDGTDAVMLSGESAIGKYPVEAVKMLAKIAIAVEPAIEFANYPPTRIEDTDAISEALHAIDDTLDLQCIVALTETGYTARLASQERPKAPIVAYTPHEHIYRYLSLIWGIRPVLTQFPNSSLEHLLPKIEADLVQRQFAAPGDKILIMGGLPMGTAGGTNFLKIHTLPQPTDLGAESP